MEPVIRPLSRDESSFYSRRAAFDRTRRLHAGTLNIFATEDPMPSAAVTRPVSRLSHHNDESKETREFSWPRLRRITPRRQPETPRGIHNVQHAAGKEQNIQVVGITDAYKDSRNIPRPRSGLRCAPRSNPTSMHDVMSYGSRAGGCDDELRNRRPHSRVVTYSQQERFCQAVRDHAQSRRGGVTEFYVNLARGRVGQIAAATRIETPREWHLEDAPQIHTLTLGSCRDQLQSLTGISLSLPELAEMIWGAKENIDAPVDNKGAGGKQLHELRVTYRDFSLAFGDNTGSDKLATLKI